MNLFDEDDFNGIMVSLIISMFYIYALKLILIITY